MLAFVPELAREVQTGQYGGPASPVGMNHVAVENIVRTSADRGVDAGVHAPLVALLERRIADGHATGSFASIVEAMRRRDPRPSTVA